MKVTVYWHSQRAVTLAALTAFARGCGAELRHVSEPRSSDIAVMWGWPRTDGLPAAQYKDAIINSVGLTNTIFLEHGYLQPGNIFANEGPYFAVSWGGVIGYGDHVNRDCPPDRFAALDVTPAAWRAPGAGYVLLIGQMPQFGGLFNPPHLKWLEKTCAALKRQGQEVLFRGHPRVRRGVYEDINMPLIVGTYAEALEGAAAVVTQNSKAAVAAAVAGVPVFALDRGCMAEPVANPSLRTLRAPRRPDRTQWLADLAYAQWTIEEMRSGVTWRRLLAHRGQTDLVRSAAE